MLFRYITVTTNLRRPDNQNVHYIYTVSTQVCVPQSSYIWKVLIFGTQTNDYLIHFNSRNDLFFQGFNECSNKWNDSEQKQQLHAPLGNYQKLISQLAALQIHTSQKPKNSTRVQQCNLFKVLQNGDRTNERFTKYILSNSSNHKIIPEGDVTTFCNYRRHSNYASFLILRQNASFETGNFQ